jgi:hypothetical protein
MNRAQKNKALVDEALKSDPEAIATSEAVRRKVESWMPEGGDPKPWAEELFLRLWLFWIEHGRRFPSPLPSYHADAAFEGAKGVMHKVMQPRFPGYHGKANLPFDPRNWCSDQTDDEFEELLEDWHAAVSKARGEPEDTRPFIADWILDRIEDGDIDWHLRDHDYWRELLIRVDRETRLPPKRVEPRTARSRARTWRYFSSRLVEKARFNSLEYGWFENVPETPADWVRRSRYVFRAAREQVGALRGQDPIRDYGERIGELLLAQMARLRREINDPCMDNFRFADASEPGDMKRYKRRVRQGCCGSHDTTVTIRGKVFWIGCNYGH